MTERTITEYPSTVVSNDAVGAVAWSSPSNAETENDTPASAAGEAVTEWLLATGYDFGIPGSANPLTALLSPRRRSRPGQQAQEYLLSLNPDAAWGLGEADGDALDLVGGNDGAVTVGNGARAQGALDDGGDGSIGFDESVVDVDAGPAIADPFDGGGAVLVLLGPAAGADGTHIFGDSGGGWGAHIRDESGGSSKIRFVQAFSSSAGTWTTASEVVDLGKAYAVAILYDAGSTANNPTIYLYDIEAETLTTFTVGDNLTRNGGSGTRDSTGDLEIGRVATGWLGTIDEFAIFNGSQPSEGELEAYFALVSAERTAPEDPVRDDAVRLVVGGAIQGGDHASEADWSDSYRDDELGPIDLSSLTAAQVNASGFGGALSADVPEDGVAEVDALPIQLTYDIAVDVTITDPTSEGTIDWPNYTVEITAEIDSTPVDLESSRWRIYSDAAGEHLVYDSGIITSTALTHVIGSGSPTVPWALPRDGETYWLLVDVTEDGEFDGEGSITGQSALHEFSINSAMSAVANLDADPVTEEA